MNPEILVHDGIRLLIGWTKLRVISTISFSQLQCKQIDFALGFNAFLDSALVTFGTSTLVVTQLTSTYRKSCEGRVEVRK